MRSPISRVVASLNEHLLDECDGRANFAPCPTCAAAVRVGELAAHAASPACEPADGAARCALCHQAVQATPEGDGWVRHLMGAGAGACTANPRSAAPRPASGGGARRL